MNIRMPFRLCRVMFSIVLACCWTVAHAAITMAPSNVGPVVKPIATTPATIPSAPAGGSFGIQQPAAQVVKVGPGTSLSTVLAMPDSTILEGPDGKRVSMGEFKLKVQEARVNGMRPGRASAPGKRIQVALMRKGQSLAQKIQGYRNAENAAAQRVMTSATFKGVGQLPPEKTQGETSPASKFVTKTQLVGCALQATGVSSVNGRKQGVVFTPGASYAIQGCGFGDKLGKAYVVGTSSGLGSVAVQVPLQIQPQDWSNAAIHASVDGGISGIGDIANATLVVQPATGAPLQQAGDQFYAAREVHPLALPAQYIEFNSSVDWVQRYGRNGNVDRGYCTGGDECKDDSWVHGQHFPGGPQGRTDSYCAGWPPGAKDVWRLDKVIGTLAKSGFEIGDNIDVQNTTTGAGNVYTDTENSGISYVNRQEVDMGTFSSWQQDNDLYVQFQGHSYYFKSVGLGITFHAFSLCSSSYRVSINVTGPRGLPVPSL